MIKTLLSCGLARVWTIDYYFVLFLQQHSTGSFVMIKKLLTCGLARVWTIDYYFVFLQHNTAPSTQTKSSQGKTEHGRRDGKQLLYRAIHSMPGEDRIGLELLAWAVRFRMVVNHRDYCMLVVAVCVLRRYEQLRYIKNTPFLVNFVFSNE